MKVRVPIADHGKHPHKFQFPVLTTFNFQEIQPVFIKPLRKGEKVNVSFGALSRLNAVQNPAFATGRYNFRSFFVPHKYVFRPWANFIEQTYYQPVNGNSAFIPLQAPYVTLGNLSKAFHDMTESAVGADNALCAPVTTSGDPYDFSYGNYGSTRTGYKFTVLGTTVYKALCNLGLTPTWVPEDDTKVNILPLLEYFRLFLDYYFPKQYVGGSQYNALNAVIHLEDSDYNALDTISLLLRNIIFCTSGYYQQNIFDLAFDNPVSSNNGVLSPSITVSDNTNDYPYRINNATGASTVTAQHVSTAVNENGTPGTFINVSGGTSTVSTYVTRLNQYILDALQSVNNFMVRHRLSSGRLFDRWLADRGDKLDHDSCNMSYWLDSKDLEIEIDAVENNTSDGLGDLAGKGVASTKNSGPLRFDCEAMDDGIFFIVCYCMADCDQPIALDPWNLYVSANQFYQPQFDKLGMEAIPAICNFVSNVAIRNYHYDGSTATPMSKVPFGFFDRYCGEIFGRPRLTGDFRVPLRGARELESYHTFRLLAPVATSSESDDVTDYSGHSLSFQSSIRDRQQYNRLFASDEVDNLQLFLRFYGVSYQSKLPIGQNYDWDDDEFNRKVDIELSSF